MILQEEPLHAPSLRALANLDGRTGARDGGRRYLELLAVAGTITDDERRRLAETPRATDDEAAKLARRGRNHQLGASRGAGAGRSLRAALWKRRRARARARQRRRRRQRARLARRQERAGARLRRLRATARQPQDGDVLEARFVQFTAVALVAAAADVDRRRAQAHRRARRRRRALPRRARARDRAAEYIWPPALLEFARLFAAILRAFHPRHARRKADEADEAAMWRRARRTRSPSGWPSCSAIWRTPDSSSHRWRRGAEDGQPRGPARLGRHHRRGARAAPKATRKASRIWRAASGLPGPAGRSWTAPSVDGKSASDVSGTRHRHRRRRAKVRRTRGSEAARRRAARPSRQAHARDPKVAVDTVRAGHDLVFLVGSRERAPALEPWFVRSTPAIVGIVDDIDAAREKLAK